MTKGGQSEEHLKRYFDAIIVVPLEEEFAVAVEHFQVDEDLSNSKHLRLAVSTSGKHLHILLVKQAAMGRTASQEAALDCLDEFDAGILICFGIAGGLSSDVVIGDICYSGRIIDVLDNVKASDTPGSKQDLTLSPTTYSSPPELTIPITLDRLLPATKPGHVAWTAEREQIGQRLIPNEFTGKDGKKESIRRPSVREGAIACGLVSASPDYNKKLKAIDRKILAIETESGGLFSIAQQRGVPALTVRGISDYAGVDKNKFEQETGNNARTLAASNAISFLVRQLSMTSLLTYFDKTLAKRASDGSQLPLLQSPSVDPVEAALIKLNEDVGSKLRDLSPGYALTSRGYRLPVPRIRILDTRSGSPEENESHPVEVREALRDARIITLHVPPEYPDLSVSWIIASDLLSAQIEEKQLIPCVVEAHNLHKPRFGIAELIDPQITRLRGSEGLLNVFIINDFNFGSKTRIDFLREQIQEWPDAKFVVVTHSQKSIVLESEFTNKLASSTARVCDVSFKEIAYFVQKNFEMTASASEVVAARLHDTFHEYALPAHPSYFAGIPRNMLTALLQANRRAELIELAVAGYLSFVVAEDVEPIALSRKTREKFLTELAYSINAEGHLFTEAELTTYTESFAAKFDFNISPARFVALFIEKCILHIGAGGKIRFTLPFMESYLLAKRLTENPDEADTYFCIGSKELDNRTFTLYAEMGASEVIVKEILRKLDWSIEQLAFNVETGPILLDSSVSPALLARQDRFYSIQKMLRKAEEDVRNERDQSHEKQRLLDVSDKVRATAAARLDAAQRERSQVNEGDDSSVQQHPAAVWAVAVSLLGAGAERLEAKTKRELVGKTIKLSGLVIDKWTRANRAVDFQTIKTELLDNEIFIGKIAKSKKEQDIASAKAVLRNLIELAEYLNLSTPFVGVLTHVCEEARDSVLAESIINTSVDGELEELIRNIWLSDINPPKGRVGLLRSIKALPRSLFLRTTITGYVMFRVFWKHWRKEDRLILLNAADESLKGAGIRYKTSELVRRIEKLPDTEESDL
jgi:nucleoside phosphorylase